MENEASTAPPKKKRLDMTDAEKREIELAAIRGASAAISPLPRLEQIRVINWLCDYFSHKPQ